MLVTSNRADGLSDTTVRKVALQALEDPPDDLQQPEREHAFLAEEAVGRRQILESRLRAEIEAVRTVGERARTVAHLRLLAAVLVFVISLVLIVSYADVVFGSPTKDGWIILGAFGSIALISAVFGALYLRRAIAAWTANRAAQRSLDEAIYQQVQDVLREIINDRWEEEALWGLEFDSTSAPTMVGAAIDKAVSSKTYIELSNFVEEHSTSAIGIAGPRGVGKSTLMEQLRFDPRLKCIGVRISAPRRYEPAALIRLIHRTMASEVLWPGVAWRPTRPRRFSNSGISWAVRWLIIISAIALWVYLWLQDTWARQYDNFRGILVGWTTIFLLVAGGVLLSVAISAMWRSLAQVAARIESSSSQASPAASLAIRELERLDYSTVVQTKTSLGWKLGVVSATGEDQVNLTERLSTNADMVASLSWFLRELRKRIKKRIIVCIDELDKIDKSDDVVSMINGIKDLFHIPGVHVVVSVSTDAMHSFAARGVLVRDVFDSAFDTVIQVQRMNIQESRDVLWRRATNFSVPAMMFCHVWSGGHPRDLIRAARACVTLRAEACKTLRLAEVVDAVVLQEVLDLLEAAAGKIYDREAKTGSSDVGLGASILEQSSQNQVRDIMALQELLRETTGPLHERIRPLLAQGSLPAIDDLYGESSTLIRVLDPYLRFAASVSEFFGKELTGIQWRSAATDEMVRALAQAQIALSRHPDEAARAVKRVELQLQSDPFSIFIGT
jgi:Cdc6-like AAA superfamily ATPase